MPTVTAVGLKVLAAGTETHDAGGTRVSIFDPNKTVALLFEVHARVGLDVALEALPIDQANSERGCLAHQNVAGKRRRPPD